MRCKNEVIDHLVVRWSLLKCLKWYWTFFIYFLFSGNQSLERTVQLARWESNFSASSWSFRLDSLLIFFWQSPVMRYVMISPWNWYKALIVDFTFPAKILSNLLHTVRSIHESFGLGFVLEKDFMMYILNTIILATRVVSSQALRDPKGLAQIHVGDGGYYFSPNQLTAPSGSEVRFNFYGVSFALSRLIRFMSEAFQCWDLKLTSFSNKGLFRPSVHLWKSLPSTLLAAFYSGFITRFFQGPVARIHFTITLDGTDPIWFYCSQKNFCQRNTVRVINPWVEF